MVRILERAELPLEQDLLAALYSFVEEKRNVTYVRRYHFLIFFQSCHDLIRIESRLVVEMLQQHIFLQDDPFHLFTQKILIHEQLLHLETDLGIFIRIERSYA